MQVMAPSARGVGNRVLAEHRAIALRPMVTTHAAQMPRVVAMGGVPAPSVVPGSHCVVLPRSRPALAPTEHADRRRALLMTLGTVALLPLACQPALAVASSTLCVDTPTEEEDRACRRSTLAQDAPDQATYSEKAGRKFELAPNVPVSVLNDEYTQTTLKLMDAIETYCSMDVYNKSRVPLIKALKTDSAAWVAKYARGGSARSQSARRMYIAVDAVVGHLASNGLAPLPAPKVRSVLKTVSEAKDFLAKSI